MGRTIIKRHYSFFKRIILFLAIIVSSGCATLHYDTRFDKAKGYAEIIVKDPRGPHQHIHYVDFESENGCKGRLDFDTPYVDATKFRVPPGKLNLQLTLYYSTYLGQDYTGHSFIYKYSRDYSTVDLSVNVEKGKRYFISSLDPTKVYTEEEWQKLPLRKRSAFLQSLW